MSETQTVTKDPILFLDKLRDESADSLLQAVTKIALVNSNHRN